MPKHVHDTAAWDALGNSVNRESQSHGISLGQHNAASNAEGNSKIENSLHGSSLCEGGGA